MKLTKVLTLLIVVVIILAAALPIHAAGYDIKFEVVSTSPIGATIRATIDGNPQDVQMVVLNLEDIQKGLKPEESRQQEIKYAEVNQITSKIVEYKTGIMGDRDITIDDVIAKATATETETTLYSKATIDYLTSVKTAKAALSTKAALTTEFTEAPKEAKAEVDKIMAEMPATVRDIVAYDVKQVEEEVKTPIVKVETKESTLFDVKEPMTLEATVTSGGWESELGWGSTGVLALIIDGTYYYDMSNSSWWSTAYEHRMEITVPTTNIDADLTDFPLKLWLSSSSGTGNTDVTAFFDELSYANRKKMAITDSTNTTQYYVEIVSGSTEWTAETVEMYTKVPLGHDASSIFYLYYDSGQSENTTYVGDTGSTPAKAVWDANFVAVYHMNDGADNAHIYDSTTNANHGTKKGAAEPAVADGLKGKAQSFDGSDDFVQIANAIANNITARPLVIEAVHKPNGGSVAFLVAKNNDAGGAVAYGIVRNPASSGYMYSRLEGTDRAQESTGASPNLTWNYDAMVWNDAGSAQMYATGAASGSAVSYTGTLSSTTFLWLGKRNGGSVFTGVIDEVRISNIARSAAWIKATNYSERDTLISWGSETNISVPSVTTSAASSVDVTTATLNGDVTSANNGDLTVRGFEWDTDSGAPYANDWNEASSSTGTFTHGVTSLTSSTIIYFRAYATNQAGTGYGAEQTFTTAASNISIFISSTTGLYSTNKLITYGVLISMLICFTVLSYWRGNAVFWMITSGLAVLVGLYGPDALGKLGNGKFGIGIGLLLITYSLLGIGLAYANLFRNSEVDKDG